jgi:CubicO group peptidase (beta-lactamase class C family)
VLQRITGCSLPQFCANEVVPSLEWLTSSETAKTYWLGKPNYKLNGSNLAADFERVNNEISARTALVPGAGMYASARSLAAFYASLLQDDSAVFQRYTQVQTRGLDKITGAYVVLGRGFGLGWRLPHPYGYWNSQHCFGHCGGFSVVAYADRNTHAAVAMVTNGNRSVTDLVRRFAPLSTAIRRALLRR